MKITFYRLTNHPVKAMFKVFQKKQTLRAMIGYCLKQASQPHFKMYVKNISEQEVAAARAEYGFLSTDPAEGKVTIVKKNLFRLAFAVYKEEFSPLKKTFIEVLGKIITFSVIIKTLRKNFILILNDVLPIVTDVGVSIRDFYVD